MNERMEVLEQRLERAEQNATLAYRAARRWRWGATGALAVALMTFSLAPVTAQSGGLTPAQITFVQDLFTRISLEGPQKTEVKFHGVNVHVQSNSGATWGAVNGLGNLIVGYNEALGTSTRTGSHNLVIGGYHSYSSYSGFVGGYWNNITAPFATVTGGSLNTASGEQSTVSGGYRNISNGEGSYVGGGDQNQAKGLYSSVMGGASNTALEGLASVSGGRSNVAQGVAASVTGGHSNVAQGNYAAVTGGYHNLAKGITSSVTGGDSNSALAGSSTVSGGYLNTIMSSGGVATISGGYNRQLQNSLQWRGGGLVQPN